MTATDIRPGRLSDAEYAENFSDLHPPLDHHEALVEADRCYFCYDAPCMNACPTSIDIPMFIRQIQTGNPVGAAKTIFEQNILGGMCARVCPTETLCEEVCVREVAEGKPVKIGELQRFATDTYMGRDLPHPFNRAASTGKKVAVVGAGPAGLSCAHRLAMHGHDITILEAREKPGGLNEYGIAAYKSTNDFAQREVEWLMQIGGIELRLGQRLGSDFRIEDLAGEYDAVFVGIGLPSAYALSIPGSELPGVEAAIDFIARLRQADDKSSLPVGQDVVVVGGGMTAVDAAVQSKLLGARTVSLVYRRGREQMPASRYEQDLAAAHGVHLVFNAMPSRINGANAVESVTFEYTTSEGGKLTGTGETFEIPADQVLAAIGQWMQEETGELELDGTTLAREAGNRSLSPFSNIWVGGDCAHGGEDLTVTAVEDGKIAAESIHKTLAG
ncbi:MAG: NAD(P)-dependent oxidoreductase [Hoeflea sp.]|uniref:NAD(P)-dependent oxidoreductase n=1 Tax=Hoeflea sp. TaxID=1940281 RepID=UPI0032EC48D8